MSGSKLAELGFKKVKDESVRGFYFRGLTQLGLPGIPKRPFLYPFDYPDEEFTFIVPFYISHDSYSYFTNDYTELPSLYLESIGDNWEIYLNGTLIKSEMNLKNGEIEEHHNEVRVFFPFHLRVLHEGENVLTFRIVGDPTSKSTGFYWTKPYYIGSYTESAWQNDEYVTIAFVGVYLFMGLFHFFRFLLQRKESYNLYYALFSTLLGFYFSSRSVFIYNLIPNTLITSKIELCSVFLMAPAVIFFIEKYCINRIFLITKCWSAVYAVMAVLVLFFSFQFAQDMLIIWQLSSAPVAIIVIIFDGVIIFKIASRKLFEGKNERNILKIIGRTFLFTPTGNILLGVIAIIGSALFDIFASAILQQNITSSRYGFFFFTIAIAFLIAQRFNSLYLMQKRIIRRSRKSMNVRLVDWIMIKDQDPELIPPFNTKYAILFTDIRNFTRIAENTPLDELFKLVRQLNEAMAQPMFEREDSGSLAYTDKFIGDGTMNIFEDPEIALKTALEFQSRLKEFNRKIHKKHKENAKRPKLEIGCGLSFGPVIMGLMGHSRRLDYTALGDTVNRASRLEDLTKSYRTPVLFDGALLSKINAKNFTFRLIDKIRVKNSKKAVDLYEEFSGDPAAAQEIKQKTLPKLQELQALYFSGKDWENALKLADELQKDLQKAQRNALEKDAAAGASKKEHPLDYLPFIYYKRIKYLLAHPKLLANWDGVYTFTHK